MLTLWLYCNSVLSRCGTSYFDQLADHFLEISVEAQSKSTSRSSSHSTPKETWEIAMKKETA